MTKKTFREYLAEDEKKAEDLVKKVMLFEHQVYKNIPGTKNSYREDPANTNTSTVKHSHIYAKPKGKGAQLYSVNVDGSGHDGSSGIEIPSSHANFFRGKGYDINSDNILESIYINNIDADEFEIILLEKVIV